MKFNNEIELPRDIGHEIASRLSVNDTLNASKTCKNWCVFFSNDELWKKYLTDIDPQKLDDLKKVLSAQNYKELYKKLISPSRLKSLFYFEKVNCNLKHIQIQSPDLQKIIECITAKPTINQINTQNEEIQNEGFFELINMNLYNSIQHYTALKILGSNYVTLPKKLVWEETESRCINEIFKILLVRLSKGNQLLLKNLQYINREDIFLLQNLGFNLPFIERTALGTPKTQIVSSLIPTNDEIIYFTQTISSYLIEASESHSGQTKNEASNFFSNYTIEITPNGVSLLNFNIAVSDGLYPIYSKVFSSRKIEKFLALCNPNEEFQHTKKHSR